MKAYIVRTDNHRDGFKLYTRNGLVKKLDPNDRRSRIYRLQISDADCKTNSFVYYEGCNVSEAIDEIDRCNNWGVWVITVTTAGSVADQMEALFGFKNVCVKTYIVSTQDIIGDF